MENPIDKTFAIVKWWSELKLLDKLLVYLLTAIISLATSLINVINTNAKLQENRIQTEFRNSNNLQQQRDKDDSLRANDNKNCELEKQEIYDRAGIIKTRNDKIQKAIK